MKKMLLWVAVIICGMQCVHAQTIPPGLIINEFSQGVSGSGNNEQEYIEFVVVGTRTCTDSTLDLRKWVFDDNNGWYNGSGVAAGHFRFADIANWQSVPYGSIILVYNNSDKNPRITLPDDQTDANHDHIYIVPVDGIYMEQIGGVPASGASSSTFVYPSTGYSQAASGWSSIIGLRNGGDAIIVVKPTNLGIAYHSIAYGDVQASAPGYQTATINAGSVNTSHSCYLSDAQYTQSASYISAMATLDTVNLDKQTPGTPNTPANAAWIAGMLVQNSAGATTHIYDTICQGQSVVFNGNTYTAAGTDTAFYPRTTGCDSVVVLHIYIPVSQVTASSNSPICNGQNLTLFATNAGTGVTYSWLGPNGFVSNLQNPVITAATGANTGTYSVIASLDGCTATSSVPVTVSGALPAPVINTNSPLCKGDTLKLTTAAVTGTPATYNWTGPNGFSANSQNPAIPNATRINQGTYTLFVTSGGCQSATGTAVVVIDTVATPQILNGNIACEGSLLQFTTNAVAGATYNWAGPNFNSSLQNPSISNISAANAGTYGLYITVNGCKSATATQTITVNSAPAAPVTTPIIYCQYATPLPLTATGTSLLYYAVAAGGVPFNGAPIPSTAVAGTTNYYVTQTVNGCESPRTILVVTINPTPKVNIGAAVKPNFCQGDTLTVAGGTGAAGATYMWYLPDGAVLLKGTLQDPSQITVQLDSAGGQRIGLVAGNGTCADTADLLVQVNATPNGNIQAKKDVCPGELVSIGLSDRINTSYFTVTYPGATLTTYDAHLDLYYVKWNTAGNYQITETLVSSVCPAQVLTEIITVHDYPSAEILGPQGTACAGVATSISAANSVAGYIYNWQPSRLFPDGTNLGVNVMPILEPNTQLYLTVTDNFGCSGTDSLAIAAEPCCTVAFPTGFTPNGDGLNDLFRPITIGSHKLNNFVVENRYGEVVFESRDEKNGWNGKYKGIDQPIGTYYYFIKFLCSNGKETVQRGDVELIR